MIYIVYRYGKDPISGEKWHSYPSWNHIYPKKGYEALKKSTRTSLQKLTPDIIG
jgi:hypothetical protein